MPWGVLKERLREAAGLLERWPPEAPEDLAALAAELRDLIKAPRAAVADPAAAARLAELRELAAGVLEVARARQQEAVAGLARVRRTRALAAVSRSGRAGGHVDLSL
ncbi:MAG: hypothetical protein ACUVTQ_05330 [Desulfotomaculales bacterium]